MSLLSCWQQPATTDAASMADTAANTVMLTRAQIQNAGIILGKAQIRSMASRIKVNGVVEVPPQGMVTVSFPLGGYIKSTELLPGMRLRKGQTLAVIQDPQFVQLQQDYLTAKSRLGFLQKEATRQQSLNATKATSDRVYEQTESDFAAQKILVSALAQKLLLIGISPGHLTDATIRSTVAIPSPISGYVASVKVNVGKYVNPSDVLFELVNTADLHLALTVFEKDLPSIREGQQVSAWLTSDTATLYPAEVILAGKTLDSNRSATVHCHFLGGEPPLLPGMFMSAWVHLPGTQSVAVPEEAVVRAGSGEYVLVEKEPSQFVLTPVQRTTTENGFVAIRSEDDDLVNKTIIIKNAYAALMELKNTGEEE